MLGQSRTVRAHVLAPSSPPAAAASPIADKMRSHWSESEEADTAQPLTALGRKTTHRSHYSSVRSTTGSTYSRAESVRAESHRATSAARNQRPIPAPDPIITISAATNNRNDDHSGDHDDAHNISTSSDTPAARDNEDDDDDDYVTVEHPAQSESNQVVPRDKASRVLGIKHRKSMEPVPAGVRTSVASVRSVPVGDAPPTPTSSGPTLPLASLYVVSGLPKNPSTWTLADPDSVLGVHHSDGAVGRWWRPEVLGSTVSPGAGGGKKRRKSRAEESSMFSSSAQLTKQDVGKMLSKALKLSFTREVEIVASTLQPASTVHNFTFNLPAPSTPLGPTASTDLLRASVLSSTTDPRSSVITFPYPYADDPFSRNARPSSAFLGPPSSFLHPNGHTPGASPAAVKTPSGAGSTITYHGVCLTVWSHADAERTVAIRRTLEASRARKESANSLVPSTRVRSSHASLRSEDPTARARRRHRMGSRNPWGAGTDAETDMEGTETDAELDAGAISESDFEVASTTGHGPGESTLFLPGDTVFWLPYALTLVSRFPIYDLMRDYLTLSWARFSKDVQSHTLQISKILSHPAPRPGELVRLDASSAPHGPSGHASETSLEVVSRFPGGLDFGRGLVDVNFTMWPLFKCLNIDNILTACEIALSPTGRVLFYSRHPAMLGIAVLTVKYLAELRGWNGVALTAVHSRDAKIYVDDPGPWIIGLATEARYAVRAPPEVCVVDLDINYLNCSAPPHGSVSVKQQRDKYRQRLLAAFEPHYHPDHCVPSEFKEAFPAGRFRPVCKIQAKRGAASTAVADMIKPPEWWHSTRIIQAFDSVLQDKMKKPSLLKRISSLGAVRAPPRLSQAEQQIQLSIRKRAMAFVDARDDLETKIGRLSRRLNFLMTESDLWRDKFVSFEQYAEKLSQEAGELRSKINKEQRETKRLSSMISSTAVEKTKLETQLVDTELAHREALKELEGMRKMMLTMEMERAQMIAEVEDQIRMITVQIDPDEYGESRPSSRMSVMSAPGALHKSDSRPRSLHTSNTEATLVESVSMGNLRHKDEAKTGHRTSTVPEVDEPGPEEAEEVTVSPTMKKKRFSASRADFAAQDGMAAVDDALSNATAMVNQSISNIQRRLESVVAASRRSLESDSEFSEAGRTSRTRRRRGSRPSSRTASLKHDRLRSITIPSEVVRSKTLPTTSDEDTDANRSSADDSDPTDGDRTIAFPVQSPTSPEEHEHHVLRKIPSNESVPASHRASSTATSPITPSLTTGTSIATTDDEDADFQSAYSTSPRGSYGSFDHYAVVTEVDDSEVATPTTISKEYIDDFSRERASSTGTAKATRGPYRSEDVTVVTPSSPIDMR